MWSGLSPVSCWSNGLLLYLTERTKKRFVEIVEWQGGSFVLGAIGVPVAKIKLSALLVT
jgi:hypothetical protein